MNRCSPLIYLYICVCVCVCVCVYVCVCVSSLAACSHFHLLFSLSDGPAALLRSPRNPWTGSVIVGKTRPHRHSHPQSQERPRAQSPPPDSRLFVGNHFTLLHLDFAKLTCVWSSLAFRFLIILFSYLLLFCLALLLPTLALAIRCTSTCRFIHTTDLFPHLQAIWHVKKLAVLKSKLFSKNTARFVHLSINLFLILFDAQCTTLAVLCFGLIKPRLLKFLCTAASGSCSSPMPIVPRTPLLEPTE